MTKFEGVSKMVDFKNNWKDKVGYFGYSMFVLTGFWLS